MKVHKDNSPLRPIISMVATPQYELAKYLDSIIKPCIPNRYMLNSTEDFLTKLRDVRLPSQHFFVSYDVESLFTNIPLDEVIELACKYVYGPESDDKPAYDIRHFRKLLKFACNGIFLYKDSIFKQVNGVAMGSPLAPTLANLFLAHHEQTWINNNNAPFMYCRYVDDIFCIFEGNTNSNRHHNFLEFLNTRHDNLRFTVEIGPNCIPFLDVNVASCGPDLDLSVFRKATYTGLLLNFRAMCPIQRKRSLIACFVARAFRICNSWTLLHHEFSNIRNYFLRNGYPLKFIQDNIDRCIFRTVTGLNKIPRNINRLDYKVICLPYFGSTSEKYRKMLARLLKQYDIPSLIVFRPYKVGTYFSLKSQVPYSLKAGVVYRYVCPVNSGISYIGKTSRHFFKRVKEHVAPERNSPILNHMLECSCTHNLKNFNILRTARNDYDLSVFEALYIGRYRPSLNSKLANSGSSFYLKLF